MKLQTNKVTQGQLSWHHALRHVANKCGRNWKSKLKQAWENANIPPECDRGYYDTLIQIRNQMDDLDTYQVQDQATLVRWQAEFDEIKRRDEVTGSMLQQREADVEKRSELKECAISYFQSQLEIAENNIESCKDSIDKGDFVAWKRDQLTEAVVIRDYSKRAIRDFQNIEFDAARIAEIVKSVMYYLSLVDMQSTEGDKVKLRIELKLRAEFYYNVLAFSESSPLN